MRLTGSVVQPRVSNDLLSYKAIGSNYLSFVVTSMLVSTSPLDEAGTATIWLKYDIMIRNCPNSVAERLQYRGWINRTRVLIQSELLFCK